MEEFKHPNTNNNWVCPACKTNKDEPIVLIPIIDTEDDNKIQVEQFHVNCIRLIYHREQGILAQKL